MADPKSREPSRPVAFGLDIPQSLMADNGTMRPPEWFALIESSPVTSVWTLDQLTGHFPSAEPVSLLSFAAAYTKRLRLGIGVYVAAARNPIHAAKSLATLDRLSGGGRLVVGVGTGDANLYPAFRLGGPDDRPGRLLDEFLAVVARLWTEQGVTHRGPTWPMSNVTVEPKPTAVPPIWVGGSGQAALRRTVATGDGWIGAGRHTAGEFAAAVRGLRALLEEAGRPVDDVTIAKRVYLMVDRDHLRAQRTIREWFGVFYGRPEMGEQVTVFGDVDECAGQLAQLIAAGASELVLHPLAEDPDQLASILDELLPRTVAQPPSRPM